MKQLIHVTIILLGYADENGHYDGDDGVDNYDTDADYEYTLCVFIFRPAI